MVLKKFIILDQTEKSPCTEMLYLVFYLFGQELFSEHILHARVCIKGYTVRARCQEDGLSLGNS